MKKYMNPGLVRPPNAALAIHSEAQRAALLSLASATNVPVKGTPASSKGAAPGSPPSKSKPKGSLQHQHTAHGIHGPAHGTAARTQASALSAHASHKSASASAASKALDIGAYDGGFEKDLVGKEGVTGEAAKLLEMDSGAANG
jgi:aurora kinase